MIREEFSTAANVCFERLVGALQDLPAERFELPLADDPRPARDVIADLAARAERMIRALELVVQQRDVDLEAPSRPPRSDSWKRAFAGFQIAHATLLAALERVPQPRFGDSAEIPQWLIEHYLTPLEQALPRFVTWASELRQRGLGGPSGLPVIQ